MNETTTPSSKVFLDAVYGYCERMGEYEYHLGPVEPLFDTAVRLAERPDIPRILGGLGLAEDTRILLDHTFAAVPAVEITTNWDIVDLQEQINTASELLLRDVDGYRVSMVLLDSMFLNRDAKVGPSERFDGHISLSIGVNKQGELTIRKYAYWYDEEIEDERRETLPVTDKDWATAEKAVNRLTVFSDLYNAPASTE